MQCFSLQLNLGLWWKWWWWWWWWPWCLLYYDDVTSDEIVCENFCWQWRCVRAANVSLAMVMCTMTIRDSLLATAPMNFDHSLGFLFGMCSTFTRKSHKQLHISITYTRRNRSTNKNSLLWITHGLNTLA